MDPCGTIYNRPERDTAGWTINGAGGKKSPSIFVQAQNAIHSCCRKWVSSARRVFACLMNFRKNIFRVLLALGSPNERKRTYNYLSSIGHNDGDRDGVKGMSHGVSRTDINEKNDYQFWSHHSRDKISYHPRILTVNLKMTKHFSRT